MTTTPRRIVCATDFSTNATAALRWAVDLAAAEGGEAIDLVTVVPPLVVSSADLMMDAGVLDVASLQAATERLRELAERTQESSAWK